MGLKRNADVTCTYTNGFDTSGTLCEQSPSGAQSDPLRRVGRSVLLAKQYVSIKEYAAILVDDKDQMICLSKLYGKESAWNPDAVNGSHYGIPQGRSEYLKDASPEQQIQWGLKYIDNRYGSPCKAWEFFQRYNYH